MIELQWGGPWPSPEAPSYGPYQQAGLEIGGGPHPKRLRCRQFDAIDWQERTHLGYDLGDARELPYDTESFDYVFASNILEHFPPNETIAVVKEWARVVKVGGYLELVVPDSMGILQDYFDGKCQWPETQERLLGSDDYPGNRHFACFTLQEFPMLIAQIPELWLLKCQASHAGSGVHAIAVRA